MGTCSEVTFLHSPIKKSVINGSDGLSSFNKPKTHKRMDIFNHSFIVIIKVFVCIFKIQMISVIGVCEKNNPEYVIIINGVDVDDTMELKQ